MIAKDLVLNIAVNLDRLSRFSLEGREKRVQQFLDDTDYYLQQLEDSVSNKFLPTLEKFKTEFMGLKTNRNYDEVWAEKALTWANILQHRAKLA